MNSMQVKDKLRFISQRDNLDFNTLLRFYVFDCFIARLSQSKYKDNFIFKGGFLISNFFGISNRHTIDIDSAITNEIFDKDNIVKIINEIISIDLKDNVQFSIYSVTNIRDEDEYGGYRINLKFNLDNIIETLTLDIVTGDPITPCAINYHYKSLLNNNFEIWSYNIETILAEKLETILSKGELSSRMKDYYDIYLIYNRSWDNIDKKILKKAIKNTFDKRQYNGNAKETFDIISTSSILKARWKTYARKYDYANNIKYEDVINCLFNIINITNLSKK